MRYVKHILLVFLCVFMFGSVSLASSGYTDQEIGDKIVELLEETYNMTDFINGNYAYLGAQLNTSNNSETYSLVTWKSGNWTTAAVGVITNVTDTSVTFNGTFYMVSRRNSDYNAIPNNNGSAQGISNIVVFGLMSSWMVNIDFENPVYDGTIFAPNFNIQNKLHAGTQNIDLEYVAIADDNIYNTEIEYYTYIKMYLYSAKDVLVDYGKYTVNSYYKSDPIVIYDYQDMHEDNTDLWLDLNNYKSDAQDFMQYVTDYVNLNYVSGMSAGTQLSRTTEFLTNLNKGFPHFVNGVEIWAQNFYIYDGTVYTSNWTKWNSTRYSDYNTVVPVADDQPANGIKNTETPTQVSDQEANTSDTYNPIGEQTGESAVNVTINNSTPNYPDYPTVATYNHDNILLQFIQTAKYIPDMFSGYGSFLASAFVFIPSGIWTIIGFGFLGSIAIMIIKVL